MEMKKAGKIQYVEPTGMAARGISLQGFTTRHEGVSRPPYNSLNLGSNTLDSSHSVTGNRSLLARAFGTSVDRLVTVNQTHGTDLLVIDAPNPDLSHFQKLGCDGVLTNQPGMMITVSIADCVPILLLDPVQRAAAALHAGWKGTAGEIARKGVSAMGELFGSEPADLLAAVGPSIGPCCYEVDGPVRDAFRNTEVWQESVQPAGTGKWRLDLAKANRLLLLQAGLDPANIETADLCVSCQPETFFSYRRDNGETGRQMGFILLK